MLLAIPSALAIQADTYFVTSHIGEIVSEEVEVIAEADGQNIELKLPLKLKNLQAFLNGDEIECELKEEINYNSLNCPLNNYEGTYFLKINYDYEPISFDNEILFKTIHGPNAKNFIYIAKLEEKYKVEDTKISSLITPMPFEVYTEAGKQVFVWKINDAEDFEASILAKEVKASKNNILLAAIAVGLILISILGFKLKKKKITPKFIETEQAVIDALKGQKKPIKQKDLQRLTGFSKARLSRVLKNLEDRDAVKSTPWGRTKLVELKK
jgi:uncharacterized membrane protein